MKTQKIDILTYTLMDPGRTLGRNNGENEQELTQEEAQGIICSKAQFFLDRENSRVGIQSTKAK